MQIVQFMKEKGGKHLQTTSIKSVSSLRIERSKRRRAKAFYVLASVCVCVYVYVVNCFTLKCEHCIWTYHSTAVSIILPNIHTHTHTQLFNCKTIAICLGVCANECMQVSVYNVQYIAWSSCLLRFTSFFLYLLCTLSPAHTSLCNEKVREIHANFHNFHIHFHRCDFARWHFLHSVHHFSSIKNNSFFISPRSGIWASPKKN